MTEGVCIKTVFMLESGLYFPVQGILASWLGYDLTLPLAVYLCQVVDSMPVSTPALSVEISALDSQCKLDKSPMWA